MADTDTNSSHACQEGCGTSSTCDNEKKSTGCSANGPQTSYCVKCKVSRAVVLANQREMLCKECLRNNLLGKFKSTVNKYGLIFRQDKVLLAFSGGVCSSNALDFLLSIQSSAKTDDEAAADRGRIAYKLGVVFVDEKSVTGASEQESIAVTSGIRAAVEYWSSRDNQLMFHEVFLEDVFQEDFGATIMRQKGEAPESELIEKLKTLFSQVKDVTGKEDLVEYLRMQVIQKLALAHGYSKIVLGLSTSRIAVKVLSSTVKGQGYSLPADIQYFDARWPVPVILPIRDCVSRDLAMHCKLSKLPTVFIRDLSTLAGPKKSINALTDDFVKSIQEENASREYTITRTAAKLQPFYFNKPPIEPLWGSTQRREAIQAQPEHVVERNAADEKVFRCSICVGPMKPPIDIRHTEVKAFLKEDDADLNIQTSKVTDQAWENELEISAHQIVDLDINQKSCLQNTGEFADTCCRSCRYQILAEDPSDGIVHGTRHLCLPRDLQERATENVRSRHWAKMAIKEYLL